MVRALSCTGAINVVFSARDWEYFQLCFLLLRLYCVRKNIEYIQSVCCSISLLFIKGAKIRNRYNQLPHLTQNTNGNVTNSQLDTTYKSQEVSPFPAGHHMAQINRRAQRHNKHKTEKNKRAIEIHKRSTALERSVKYFI